MHKAIAALLPVFLVSALTPSGALAASPGANGPPELEDSEYLVSSETFTLSNDWDHTLNVYEDDAGEVWAEGTVTDPSRLDGSGTPTRWLSYTYDDGQFEFVGSMDGEPVRVAIGPEDVTCVQDAQGNWKTELAAPGSGPQALPGLVWVAVVLVASLLLSCDGGCACGHNGGTPNNPGTNPPAE